MDFRCRRASRRNFLQIRTWIVTKNFEKTPRVLICLLVETIFSEYFFGPRRIYFASVRRTSKSLDTFDGSCRFRRARWKQNSKKFIASDRWKLKVKRTPLANSTGLMIWLGISLITSKDRRRIEGTATKYLHFINQSIP